MKDQFVLVEDVNPSFARIRCVCGCLEARASPSNGRIVASVLAVDE
jgi:hypothetical protein